MNLPKKNLSVLFQEIPFSYPIWCASFLALILVRLFSEYWLEGFSQQNVLFLFYEFSHTFLFFLTAYVLFFIFLRWAFHQSIKITALLLLYGFLITLFPSLFDHFFPVQGKFYDLLGLVQQYFTFFSDTPHMTVTHGARIEIAIVCFGLMGLAYYLHRSLLRSLLVGLGAYVIFFILGTLASIISIIALGFPFDLAHVSALQTAQLFLSPAHFFSNSIGDIITSFNAKMSIVFASFLVIAIPTIAFFHYPNKFKSLIKNARYPQLFYHTGLFFLGVILGIVFTQNVFSFSFFNMLTLFLALSAICFSWFTSIIVNDLYDIHIDAITNKERPLIQKMFTPRQYTMIGWSFFGVSLFLAALISFSTVLLLVGYHALTWLYSAWPFRLKRIPIVATLISAFASIFILLTGFFLLSEQNDITIIPAQFFLILIIAYTLALPVKDLKDLQGDKYDGVYTLPVLFGDHTSRLIMGSSIFFSYLLSVWILNEPELWIWAFLFGMLSYGIITTHVSWKRFRLHNRHLPLVILSLVLLYGMILVHTFVT